MNLNLKAFMLLNACECFSSVFWKNFKSYGFSPRQLWEDMPRVAEKLSIPEKAGARMLSLASSGWPEREYENCLSRGIKMVTLDDSHYPEKLKVTSQAPLMLYYHGNLSELPGPVGVVGTRKCSPYARRVSRRLGEAVAESGGSVISGGARGIDASAHEGALSSGGRTAAVLGTGIDVVYPRNHVSLFDRIREGGVLISEYPLGSSGKQWRFPRRNRIIAGLSDATVVVEAPQRSGALITAGYAMEYGRDVWAVPGRIDEGVCRGTNSLISDGAYPLVDIDIFTSQVFSRQLELFQEKTDNSPPPETLNLNRNERIILESLRERGDRTVDNISSEGKMSAAEVLTSLGNLCARGLVYPAGPGRWRAGI